MLPAFRTSTACKRRIGARAAIRAAGLSALVVLVFAVWCAMGAPALAQTPPPPDVYRIIVHPKNPQVVVDREFVAQSFLKKIITWGHGGMIRPVDLAIDSAVRHKFSGDVLGRSVSAVRSYWLQIVFSGRGVPPPELKSDEEVIRYVLREPGAIGYVSSTADLHGARVLVVH